MAVRLQWMRRHSFLPVNIAWLWMLFDSPMDEDSPLLTITSSFNCIQAYL